MSHPRPRAALAAASVTAALSLLTAACSASSTAVTPGATTAAGAASAPGPQVRVNQVGYPAGGPKVAYAMLTKPATRVSFTVSGSHGTVFHGSSSDEVGGWNARFPAVFRLGFSGLSRPGSYLITVSAGSATAVSPAFTVYIQTGIGSGNASNTIQGDYNFWLLPQAEDRLDVGPGGHPGPSACYVRYRPVFEAAPPGKPVSPDLAGRMAADFALGA